MYKLIGYAVANYPDKQTNFRNDPNFLNRIGVLVPCHKSEKEIENTLRSLLKYIPTKNVVIIDNANSEAHPDRTESVVRNFHKDIHYMYIPMGHKTRALWEGINRLPLGEIIKIY